MGPLRAALRHGGALGPGEDKRVLISAFADNGEELFYREAAVNCPPGYSFRAPEWSGGLSVVRHGAELFLRWEEPPAEAGIYGYRVYMDGRPVCRRRENILTM